MAKDGLKQEAGRQELIQELRQLTADNIKKDGTPRKDAVPQELKRMEEIKGLLSGRGPNDTAPAESEPTPETASETDAARIKRLEAENAELKAQKARGREAAKMKTADKKVGHVPRPDEIMGKALADAEDRPAEEWDESNKLAVERTIRRYVRKGGSKKNQKGDFYEVPAGFKKGISFEEKVYALKLLEKMGRLGCPVKDIIDLIRNRKSMSAAEQRKTNREFNQQLEILGVTWDESIHVPGMSLTLRS